MYTAELQKTIDDIAIPGKGILAADESTGTIKKRFDTINTESTEDNRRIYREMLFTTTDLADYISGVILFEETLGQKASTGDTLGNVLAKQNIVPGIKVDKGLVELAGTDKEKVTQGLDGLGDRLANYKEMGARFAKWRAVFNISDVLPSTLAIETNAHNLARYAAICQAHGIVPIVEPEVLMDGNHSIERCAEVTESVLHSVFNHLNLNNVSLEHIILKPSMVISGADCPQQANSETIAKETVKILKRTIPAAVPTINFLSGGQSAEFATENLNLMNKLHDNLPWQLSFSYGRALQAPSLEAWSGKNDNIDHGKAALAKRAQCNGAASLGQYSSSME